MEGMREGMGEKERTNIDCYLFFIFHFILFVCLLFYSFSSFSYLLLPSSSYFFLIFYLLLLLTSFSPPSIPQLIFNLFPPSPSPSPPHLLQGLQLAQVGPLGGQDLRYDLLPQRFSHHASVVAPVRVLGVLVLLLVLPLWTKTPLYTFNIHHYPSLSPLFNSSAPSTHPTRALTSLQ